MVYLLPGRKWGVTGKNMHMPALRKKEGRSDGPTLQYHRGTLCSVYENDFTIGIVFADVCCNFIAL